MLTMDASHVISFLCALTFLTCLWLTIQNHGISGKLAALARRLDRLEGAAPTVAPVGAGEKRFKYRAPSHFDGVIESDGRRFPVRIMDLSKTGALVESAEIELRLEREYAISFALGEGEPHALRILPVRVGAGEPRRYGVLFKNASVGTLREISKFVSHAAADEIGG